MPAAWLSQSGDGPVLQEPPPSSRPRTSPTLSSRCAHAAMNQRSSGAGDGSVRVVRCGVGPPTPRRGIPPAQRMWITRQATRNSHGPRRTRQVERLHASVWLRHRLVPPWRAGARGRWFSVQVAVPVDRADRDGRPSPNRRLSDHRTAWGSHADVGARSTARTGARHFSGVHRSHDRRGRLVGDSGTAATPVVGVDALSGAVRGICGFAAALTRRAAGTSSRILLLPC